MALWQVRERLIPRIRDFTNCARRPACPPAQTAGKRDEARAMLSEIYDWFTEGFDTADLKDSKALREELSA
jgi:hypothetical protein